MTVVAEMAMDDHLTIVRRHHYRLRRWSLRSNSFPGSTRCRHIHRHHGSHGSILICCCCCCFHSLVITVVCAASLDDSKPDNNSNYVFTTSCVLRQMQFTSKSSFLRYYSVVVNPSTYKSWLTYLRFTVFWKGKCNKLRYYFLTTTISVL